MLDEEYFHNSLLFDKLNYDSLLFDRLKFRFLKFMDTITYTPIVILNIHTLIYNFFKNKGSNYNIIIASICLFFISQNMVFNSYSKTHCSIFIFNMVSLNVKLLYHFKYLDC